MKKISILNILLATTISYTALGASHTLSAESSKPTVKVIQKKRAPVNPVLVNTPDGVVNVPVDVEVIKGQVYDPIDGVVYEEKEVRITPTYLNQTINPVNTVKRAVLNLSEMGWTAAQFDRLAAELTDLQTLSLIGSVPSEKYLPALRKLAGQVKDLTYDVTVSNSSQRSDALDILAELVENADSLRRLVVADRLILGNSSMSSVRNLRDALKHPRHLHYFRLLPTARKHAAWKHGETKRLGEVLFKAEQLKYIDISGNTLGYGADGKANIREVFTTFATLEGIKAINAAKNNIGSKPEDIAKVEILTDQLRQIPNLQFIDLSNNEIESGNKRKLELVRNVVPDLKALHTVHMGQVPLGEKFLILSK